MTASAQPPGPDPTHVAGAASAPSATAPDAYFALDAGFRIVAVNAAMARATGLARDALLGRDVRDAFPGTRGTVFERHYRAAMAEGTEAHFTHAYADARLDLVTEVDVYPGPDGGAAVFWRDVTARAHAEAARAASEARFRHLADAVPQIVWITDPGGRVEFFNRRWTAYTGAPYEPTTAAQVAAAFVHPDDGPATAAAFEEARRTGAPFAVEHRIRSASGAYRWFLVRAEPYRDPATGDVVRWFAASTDIDDRRRAEAALRASEARFRTVQDASPNGFAVHRPVREGGRPDGAVVDFTIPYVNAAGARIVQRTPAEVMAGTVLSNWPSTADEGVFADYVRVLETGVPSHRELLYEHDGLAAGLAITAVRIGAGPDAEVGVTFADVTERLRTEAERDRLLAEAEAARRAAEAANAAKGQFLATMSHELRTPLNAIGGYAQLLDMGLHGPVTPEQRQALARVQAAQTRLLALVNDVLNYAKLESGRVEYDVRPVDLADVVRDVAPLVEPQLRAKGLAFDVRLPEVDGRPAPCVVWADREKLGQVLVNLLSNAVKFTDSPHPATGAPGRVAVEVATRAGAAGAPAFLRVRDTGRGIPRERQDAIFEPFVQVRAGTGSAYAQATEGTGLGLAISRDLARGMGGDLRVRSTPGEGATFTVALRRAAAAGSAAASRGGDAP